MKLFTRIPQKSIVITEKQLHEAMSDNFSYDVLTNLKTFAERKQYCDKYLGISIGKGSSRIVYSINDEKCLKLAMNSKGIAQNRAEARGGASDYEVGPEVYECANDYSYIVSEYVLPARKNDFKHCLGIGFDVFCDFITKSYTYYASNKEKYGIHSDMSDETWNNLCDKHEFLQNIYGYMNYEHIPLGDLLRIRNYGMCMRDGEPQIVLLDSGFTEETAKLYERNK